MNNTPISPNTEGEENLRPQTDKYSQNLEETTGNVNSMRHDLEQDNPVFRRADDTPSSMDEEDITDEDFDNVSQQEAEDLDEAATRMPGEEDDIADKDMLDDMDLEGEYLNEGDDPLGGDLDINPEDAEPNEYDDNNG